jgi:hypothetical protein
MNELCFTTGNGTWCLDGDEWANLASLVQDSALDALFDGRVAGADDVARWAGQLEQLLDDNDIVVRNVGGVVRYVRRGQVGETDPLTALIARVADALNDSVLARAARASLLDQAGSVREYEPLDSDRDQILSWAEQLRRCAQLAFLE